MNQINARFAGLWEPRKLIAIFLIGYAGHAVLAAQQMQVLHPSDPQPFSFGERVAMSSDGATLLVSDPYVRCATGEPYCGAVYVYARNGNSPTWAQQSRLIPPDAERKEGFGSGIAVSGDGNTVLIGAPNADCVLNEHDSAFDCKGAAFLFRRQSSSWYLVHIFEFPDSGYALMGKQVALSRNGETAVIGGLGLLYVFEHSPGSWAKTYEHRFTLAYPSEIVVSPDGTNILAGVNNVGCNAGLACGAAYSFERINNNWQEAQTLTPADGEANMWFGSSVSLSGDGNTAFIATKLRSAYIFTRSEAGWGVPQKLTIDRASYIGNSLALDREGSLALYGDAYAACLDGSQRQCGSVWVIQKNGQWLNTEKIAVPGSSAFGDDVALSADGTIALIGETGGEAAYLFRIEKAANCNDTMSVLDPQCFENIAIRGKSVMVGCEIVDCCPHCPGDFFIDWIIHVEGDPIKGLVLEFDGLPVETARRLKLKNARWLKGRNLLLVEDARKPVIIKGFPASRELAKNMPAPPAISINRIVLPKKQTNNPAKEKAGITRRLKVIVKQEVAGKTINTSTIEQIF